MPYADPVDREQLKDQGNQEHSEDKRVEELAKQQAILRERAYAELKFTPYLSKDGDRQKASFSTSDSRQIAQDTDQGTRTGQRDGDCAAENPKRPAPRMASRSPQPLLTTPAQLGSVTQPRKSSGLQPKLQNNMQSR